MVEAPQTDEGWFALHDFRTVDWDAWRDAPEHERRRAIEEGVAYLDAHEAVEDAEAGASAVFSVLGHKADFVVVHFRPTLDDISRAERQFERTALAAFTEQPTSYVSVTEVSGYVSDDYFEGNEEDIDAGLLRYIEGKLKPDIPEDTYMSFYPMSKRRGEEHNWYDLSFDERRDLMSTHGDTGRKYAGKIKQVIASSVGFDDYEWGVTLFGDDPTDIKDIVYEMRFDEVSSKYGEASSTSAGASRRRTSARSSRATASRRASSATSPTTARTRTVRADTTAVTATIMARAVITTAEVATVTITAKATTAATTTVTTGVTRPQTRTSAVSSKI
jgi:chlorite dismutase